MDHGKIQKLSPPALGDPAAPLPQLTADKSDLDMSKGGHFNETGEPRFCAHDIRFTTADNAIYATCLGVPGDVVMINSFKERVHAAEIQEVRLLGQDQPLKWRMDWDEGLIIETPMPLPSEYANTFEISLVERNGQ